MAKARYEGKCLSCGKTFSKAGIARHIRARSDIGGMLFYVGAKYIPDFWMYLEIPEKTSLKKLDSFLRDVWLECCGHLSAFNIDDQDYMAYPDPDYNDIGMDFLLKKVVKEGDVFEHEYDFGTTTCLSLKFLADAKSKMAKQEIKIIARNDLPEAKCESCGEAGGWEEKEGLFCEKCFSEHGHEEEMSLPIVNSPRCGVCGYPG
jgi:hypothetical protein